METAARKILWQVIGESSRGASHVKGNLPNQDALSFWLPENAFGPPAILAIADGHGSPQHFRSASGAKLAVQAATSLLLAFAKMHGSQSDAATLRTAVAELPQRLVENWTASVSAHLAANPFQQDEFSRLSEPQDAEARAEVTNNPIVAYGATLLVVLVTKYYAVFLQIGDGDILWVDDAGKTIRPVPADTRLIANQTTSLCQAEAWKDFRWHVEAPLHNPPALILVSTDGYANSFRSDEDFLLIGQDFLKMARTGGLQGVSAQLPGILREASEKGSGDDVTFGIMCRQDAIAGRGPDIAVGAEEESMAGYISKADYDSMRAKLDEHLRLAERRLSIFTWALALALILSVVSLAISFSLHFSPLKPDTSSKGESATTAQLPNCTCGIDPVTHKTIPAHIDQGTSDPARSTPGDEHKSGPPKPNPQL